MTPAEVALGLAAWALTYALHSTLLLGGVWLITRREALFSPRLRERLWRTAALGGLVTASLQLGLGWQPPGVSWSLALPEPAALEAELALEADAATAPRRVAPLGSLGRAAQPREAVAGGAFRGAVGRPLPATTTLAVLPDAAAAPDGRRTALFAALLLALGLWAAAAALGLARLGASALRLRDRLRGRLVLENGRLRECFDVLGAGSRVELAVCPALTSPITTGVWRHRVCLPLRALTDLSPGAQECMLAHELAHARRRDGAWLLGSLVLEALLPFQPLNRLARRRASDAAEFLCDAWAVKRTGRSLDLARCLTQVASWVVGSDRQALPAPGMAGQPSSLRRRVEHLIEPPRRPLLGGHGLVWTPLLALCLGAVATAAPGVGASPAPAAAIAPPAAPEQTRPLSPAVGTPADPVPAVPGSEAATDARQLAALLELFTLLDHEVAVLGREFDLLDEEMRGTQLDPALSGELARFGERVEALRDRRDRARDLLWSLLRRSSRDAPLSGALSRP